MKFVLVNRRTPVVPSKCAARRRPDEKGYMRDLSTLRRYCGAECYPGRNGKVPPLRPCAEINPFELIFEWGVNARHRLRAIRVAVSTSTLPLLTEPFRALRMACTAEIVAACADRLVVRNGSLTRRLSGEKRWPS
jgi:hypothetical protein